MCENTAHIIMQGKCAKRRNQKDNEMFYFKEQLIHDDDKSLS